MNALLLSGLALLALCTAVVCSDASSQAPLAKEETSPTEDFDGRFWPSLVIKQHTENIEREDPLNLQFSIVNQELDELRAQMDNLCNEDTLAETETLIEDIEDEIHENQQKLQELLVRIGMIEKLIDPCDEQLGHSGWHYPRREGRSVSLFEDEERGIRNLTHYTRVQRQASNENTEPIIKALNSIRGTEALPGELIPDSRLGILRKKEEDEAFALEIVNKLVQGFKQADHCISSVVSACCSSIK